MLLSLLATARFYLQPYGTSDVVLALPAAFVCECETCSSLSEQCWVCLLIAVVEAPVSLSDESRSMV